MRRALVLSLLASSLALAVPAGPTQAAIGQPTDYWTEPSSTNVFKDSLPTRESGRSIGLDTATNEWEGAQIVVRSAAAFRVNGVTFSALARSGGGSIAASNLEYKFVTYQTLNANTMFDTCCSKQPIYPVIRTAPGEFPDNLSNATAFDVPARTTQSIWVNAFVPKGTGAGVYSGTATVQTSRGNLAVPISVDVRAVELPDSKDGTFDNSLWNTFNGELSWDPGGDNMAASYGLTRFSPKWWALMENVVEQMKRHRHNQLTIPLVGQLMDAGSTRNANGTYTFNWNRFDEVVQFFLDRNAVKRIEGFWVAADTYNYRVDHQDGVREVELINRRANGTQFRDYAPWNTVEADSFIDQFMTSLRTHLEAKGWDEMFWMHVGDEPHSDAEETAYRHILQRMKQNWPGVKVGDAMFAEPWATRLSPLVDVVVPNLLNYSPNPGHYDELRANGKDVWLYNCNIPVGNYLNRFIDQPQWHQRMTIWYASSRNLNGYLHYSMNGWLAPLAQDEVKGDHYIVWPDKPNNTIESSIRWESLRDGIEDYEALALLKRTNPGLAHDLAYALVQSAEKYSPDTGFQARIRRLMLDAAGGRPVVASDLALGRAATASSAVAGSEAARAFDGSAGTAWRPTSTGAQWLQVDLGRQVQLDGVLLRWASAAPSSYKLRISYDGVRFSDAFSTTSGDGGDDFVGVNGKARYLRLEVSAASAAYGLSSFEVAGFGLAKVNLAGGRDYSKPAPVADHLDSGFESSDGLLADDWGDKRQYGYRSSPVSVTFDLGAVKSVDSARVHAYEEYPAYRPDTVVVSTSTDGSTFTQKGWLPRTNDQSAIWYDFEFPPTSARWVRVTFNKTYGGNASALFVDEIEIYQSQRTNLAAGASYAKSPAPAAGYPDTLNGGRESTDGVIAGHHNDAIGWGVNLPVGTTGVVKVDLDLGAPKAFGLVSVRENFDLLAKYFPDTVRVLTGDSLGALTLRASADVSSGSQWYDLPVGEVTARYVRVEMEKFSVGSLQDWIFVDDIAVYPSG